jgi:hypothetical protein
MLLLSDVEMQWLNCRRRRWCHLNLVEVDVCLDDNQAPVPLIQLSRAATVTRARRLTLIASRAYQKRGGQEIGAHAAQAGRPKSRSTHSVAFISPQPQSPQSTLERGCANAMSTDEGSCEVCSSSAVRNRRKLESVGVGVCVREVEGGKQTGVCDARRIAR